MLIIGVNVEDDRLVKLGSEGVSRFAELGLHPGFSPGQKDVGDNRGGRPHIDTQTQGWISDRGSLANLPWRGPVLVGR